MLGFESRRDPIRGEFAKRVREQLRHAHASQQVVEREDVRTRELPRYHAIWK